MSFKLVLACKCLRVLYDNHSLTADALAGRVNKGAHKGATPHEVAHVLRILHAQGFVEAKVNSMRGTAKWELTDWIKRFKK